MLAQKVAASMSPVKSAVWGGAGGGPSSSPRELEFAAPSQAPSSSEKL